MKKIILSLMVVAANLSFVNAQTNSLDAGNIPTPSGEGYAFAFKGTAVQNCLGSHVAGYATGTNQTWTIDETNHQLDIAVAGSQSYPGQILKFYTGNCVSSPIDLTTTANQKISFKITSDVAVPELVITILNSAGTQSNNALPNIVALTVGDNTFTDLTLTGMSGITTISDIGSIALVPRNAYNDYNLTANLKVSYFVIGDATIPTTTAVNAEVDNSLISVYPNPAKDQINLDLSSLTSKDASVKVMNSKGAVVYEANVSDSNVSINSSAFGKGMYLVQVSSGNKLSNKKIVIE